MYYLTTHIKLNQRIFMSQCMCLCVRNIHIFSHIQITIHIYLLHDHTITWSTFKNLHPYLVLQP